jgi:hypothetical protein
MKILMSTVPLETGPAFTTTEEKRPSKRKNIPKLMTNTTAA